MKNVKNQLKSVGTAHTIHSQTKALFTQDKYYQGTSCDLEISSHVCVSYSAFVTILFKLTDIIPQIMMSRLRCINIPEA